MSTRRNLFVFISALVIVGVPSLYLLNRSGFDEDAFGVVLRTSARLALIIYLLIFSIRPLHQLVASTYSRTLLSNRRYIGVAFAGIMVAHLVFLLWFNGLVTPVPGMIIYALLLSMLITSFDGPRAVLGPKRWKILHKTGLYALGFAFAQTVVGGLRESPGDPVYLALAALFLLAIALRVGAFVKVRGLTQRV